MNRYQKPEVYEQLAMEYSLGTLHGAARKRFEQLMEKHPYLQAMVEEHDNKFAELIAFLPETKPDDHVWDNIHSAINQSESVAQGAYVDVNDIGGVAKGSRSWWQVLTDTGYKGFAAAMLMLVLSSVFLLQTGSVPEATGYTATLLAETSKKPMASVQVAKSDMRMLIKLNEPVPVPDGMKMVFWCIAKDKKKPYMNMGTLASQGVTEKKLQRSSWQGIVDASNFAVSLEPEATANNSSPTGNVLFIGKLKALTKT